MKSIKGEVILEHFLSQMENISNLLFRDYMLMRRRLQEKSHQPNDTQFSENERKFKRIITEALEFQMIDDEVTDDIEANVLEKTHKKLIDLYKQFTGLEEPPPPMYAMAEKERLNLSQALNNLISNYTLAKKIEKELHEREEKLQKDISVIFTKIIQTVREIKSDPNLDLKLSNHAATGLFGRKNDDFFRSLGLIRNNISLGIEKGDLRPLFKAVKSLDDLANSKELKNLINKEDALSDSFNQIVLIIKDACASLKISKEGTQTSDFNFQPIDDKKNIINKIDDELQLIQDKLDKISRKGPASYQNKP